MALGAALALAAAAPAAGEDDSLENPVKATYLYKFAPFVEWPPRALGPQDRPLDICILGDASFASIVERAVAGQRHGDRPFAVRRLAAPQAGSGRHVLYIPNSASETAAQALRSVRGEPILTVTDSANGNGPKGVVHFVLLDNRVRFEIDDAAAAEQGLRISSKLLSLASSVRKRS